jgi:hypothetical protein
VPTTNVSKKKARRRAGLGNPTTGLGSTRIAARLEARRTDIEESLIAGPATPVRLHPNLAQIYSRQVERLQEALNEPEIRDEALEILRGLIEHVSIGPAENGLEVELVGKIAKMVEFGLGNNAKQATSKPPIPNAVPLRARSPKIGPNRGPATSVVCTLTMRFFEIDTGGYEGLRN